MLQLDLIKDFLAQKTIAIVGVSRKADIPANHIFDKFRSAGYHAYPVNPNAEEIDGEKCYPDLAHLPEKPDAVLLGSTPDVSFHIASEVIELQIPRVWMHKGIGKGSYSYEAAGKLIDHGVNVIKNGCPMMFIKNVDPFHRVLRWFKGF